MNILKKIQEQPKGVRKVIFWTIIIILGIFFLFAWVENIKVRVEQAKQERVLEKLKPPEFEENLRPIPKIEVPKFPELSEEELKKLEEELIKESQQQ
jgi:cell division protein FtsN